jgi:MFS family permease
LVIGYMAIVGSSTLSYFYPTLVNGLGYSTTVSQYMTIPIYIVSFVCTAITGYFMDRHPNYRGVVLGCWMSVSMLCAIITCVVVSTNPSRALASIFFRD